MREAVIVASSRTPLAKSHRGSFNITRPDDLAAHAIRHVLGKASALDPEEVSEVVAKRYNITRESQDEYALISQQRTARGQQEGFFAGELAPMQVRRALLDKKTGQVVGEEDACIDRDECSRPDTTIEGLRKLPAVFDTTSGRRYATAGNSSQL